MTTADDRDRDIQLVLERLDALEKRKQQPPPFWRNTALVGFMGAALAVIPATLTAIQEYFQTEREVALARGKNEHEAELSRDRYQHERTIAYLDRALSPDTTEGKQAQVFRFLSYFPEGDPVREWAEGELALVEEAIDKLKKEVQVRRKEIEKQEEAIDEEIEQINDAVANAERGDPVDPMIHAAQLAIAEKKADIEKKTLEANYIEQRLSVAPSLPTAQAPAPRMGAPSLWKIRIAITGKLAEARDLVRKARGKGAAAELRKVGPEFWVLVGSYGSQMQALDARSEVRRYLGRPVAVVDVNKWCSSGTMSADYFECDPV